MATVPTLDSFTAGELVTAAKLNKNVRDAGNFFRAQPACGLRASSAQAYASGTSAITTVMDAIDFDNDSMADLANNRIVIKTAGLYSISGVLRFASGAANTYRGVRIYKNGVYVSGSEGIVGGAVGVWAANVNVVLPMAVNDNIILSAFQSSGASLSTDAAFMAPRLSARWVGV